MKIALCLSGFVRSFFSCYKSLDKYLLSVYDVDVFVTTGLYTDNKAVKDSEFDSIRNLLCPKSFTIEDHFNKPISNNILNRNIEPARKSKNVCSMLYNIEQCNRLKSAYEKQHNFIYDYVIRSRMDLEFLEQLQIPNSSNNYISIPKWGGDFYGLNDQFAYGPSKLMDIYSGLYSNIETTLESDNRLYLKPELLLKQYLKNKNCAINRFDFDYSIKRTDGSCLFNKERDLLWNNQEHESWEIF